MRCSAFIGRAGIVALMLGFTPLAVATEDHQAAIKEATSSAETWLALVDDGKYDSGASPVLQNAVTKESFAQKVAAARQSLGKVLSRTLTLARYMTNLPGAPDGE
jgi:Protein of unknown function (DUF4019)